MNFLKTSALVLASFLTISANAAASVPYKFYRHIGLIYAQEGEVYKNDRGGVTAKVLVNMPTCNEFSNLRGYIGFSFRANDGGYFNNYKYFVDYKDGYNHIEAFVNVPFDMSERGILTLTDNTYCEY